MNIRRFRALHAAGASYAEIARECGVNWRTVKKYLSDDAAASRPPVGSPRAGTQPRVIEPYTPVIDAWLRADIALRASVIYERLVAEYGFAHNYQRVKVYVRENRDRIAAELAAGDENPLSGLHRRFEVTAGAQAQVDWGTEGDLFGDGTTVYSFHLVLSYSRDLFCCYTTSMDLATFWECHRRAFAHFGGVPGVIVYDRAKTVIRRHVAPRAAVPLHPEAAAFAAHYGFDIDVLAAYRPTGKGRVERQVQIVREHVIAGRDFTGATVDDVDAAFAAWLPIRRTQVHRTHGQVIAERAEPDRAALTPLPQMPYLVTDHHLRRVGKDALISFEASMYSVPAAQVRPGQRVQVRAATETVVIRALDIDGGDVLATHPRAVRRGQWMVDQTHWDGLPDGHTRTVCLDDDPAPADHGGTTAQADPLFALLSAHPGATAEVTIRDLADYQHAATSRAATTSEEGQAC